MNFKPIGIIHSPFKEISGMPIQPTGAFGIKGEIEILPEFVEGLQNLNGFSHIILIYYFHISKEYTLLTKPFLYDKLLGVFATRAPKRPNQIGFSVVQLIEVVGNILKIQNIDIIDGTPLLDIKPYVPKFDFVENATIGWLEQKVEHAINFRSDDRFK